MDKETKIKMDCNTLPGSQFYNAVVGEDVLDDMKTKKIEKFGKKVLVWQPICSCVLKSFSFFLRLEQFGAMITGKNV